MRIIIQDTKHLKIKQDLLWVGTATLVTVIIWVVYAVYVAFNRSTVDTSVEKLLTPLNPSLDQAALTRLNDRFVPPADFTILVVNSSDGNDRQVVPLGQTTPEIPVSTLSAQLPSPTPSPTPAVNQTLF